MRFIIGLVIGLVSGLAAALLLAPAKGERRRQGGAPGEGMSEGERDEEEYAAGAPGLDHDTLARLRRAMHGLQEQVQEAWAEAREAAEEAEKEMRARYEGVSSKHRR